MKSCPNLSRSRARPDMTSSRMSTACSSTPSNEAVDDRPLSRVHRRVAALPGRGAGVQARDHDHRAGARPRTPRDAAGRDLRCRLAAPRPDTPRAAGGDPRGRDRAFASTGPTSRPGSPARDADGARSQLAVEEASAAAAGHRPRSAWRSSGRPDAHATRWRPARPSSPRRFQQFTPAVMAKGVEDTAFYRYNRLVSLNEVGGDPGSFGRSVEAFPRVLRAHRRAVAGHHAHPVHARHQTEWRRSRAAQTCCRRSRASGRPRSGGGPSTTTATERRAIPTATSNTSCTRRWSERGPWMSERLVAFLQKAAREAKVHTSWINPVQSYEDAIDSIRRQRRWPTLSSRATSSRSWAVTSSWRWGGLPRSPRPPSC